MEKKEEQVCGKERWMLLSQGGLLAAQNVHRKVGLGVPIVPQRLTNRTSNQEDEGSIPGLAQWVRDPVLW